MTAATTAPVVRAASAADHAAWLALWRGYQAFYRMDLPAATTALTWQRLLDAAEPMHLALAEVDGAVVGFVHFIEHRSTGSPANVVYLQDLFTAVGLRGRGVGSALIEHVCVHARGIGAGKVHWLTHETNAPARRLYDAVSERSGFLQYRRLL